jgi:DNA polymerase III subunit epsilon
VGHIYLDVETTGLDPMIDEVLQIGMVDDHFQGAILDILVKPNRLNEWPKAEAIHGIGPADVREALPLEAYLTFINSVCAGQTVVMYNVAFDAGFLWYNGHQPEANFQCCMLAFANYRRQPGGRNGGYKWFKLEAAAHFVGYEWQGPKHSAVSDALATRAVWHYLKKEKAV